MTRPVHLNIHDGRVEAFEPAWEPEGARWTVLRSHDSWLRRFGQADVVRLDGGTSRGFRVRRRADEVWALLEGQATFRWVDLREGSPSRGMRDEFAADSPVLVLAQFGVAFSVEGRKALLLRLCTHSDDEDPPETVPKDGITE
jgi:dTDP-4-dehydrorhamnose 3,5-epimerase-like enzyme